MVQTRKRASIRQEVTSDEDMDKSPRIAALPSPEPVEHTGED